MPAEGRQRGAKNGFFPGGAMETTVVKGLRVLETLAMAEQPAFLGEIAEKCGLSKSNVHRLLQTLDACGYVSQEKGSRRYYATLKMWEMGTRTHGRLDFCAVAKPFLTELAEKTEETVHLSVLDGLEALFIDKVDGLHAVRTYVNTGDRAPAYCSASGKAMLAYMPDDVIETVGGMIQPHTDQTVADLAELRAHLARIRSLGYSVTTGEWRPHVMAVSSAIVSDSGKPIGAVGVAGPAERMRQNGFDRYIEATVEAREKIRKAAGLGAGTATQDLIEEIKRKTT